jgi:hypothetical protein
MVVLSAGGSAASTPLTPNDSILFYQAGRVMTGVLADGLLTHKHWYETAHAWTAVAVSRDTAMFYDSSSGDIKTGVLRNGRFETKSRRTIAAGYTDLAASCDTVILYDAATGAAATGRLVHGSLGSLTAYSFAAGWQRIDASCDTVRLEKSTDATTDKIRVGRLEGGAYHSTMTVTKRATYRLAHTKQGYLTLSRGGDVWWGTSRNGQEARTGHRTDAAAWNIVAGTASTVLFYDTDGYAQVATLKNGTYRFLGVNSGPRVRSGWSIIEGGR